MNFYPEKTANFPRNTTDKFFIDYNNRFKFKEITHKTALFVEKNQLLDTELWERFVHQFEILPDGENLAWRCEYWGKMMRGACLVYSYTKNPDLLITLTHTVRRLLTTQDERGRISTYPIADEFKGWDLWGRKYVLLGMQYFLEINEDKTLAEEVIASMCRQVNYLISKLGKDEGKISITRTSKHWYGLNSSSILEPVVRLYNLTGDKKYLDFAQYIADEGATYAENIFRLAEKKQLRLYQYPVTKAYEMTSCFEGLLELYRITKTDWYKTALINFADLILEDELTVIGCAGCTHELFDRSAYRQANTTNFHIMQETCVTVTLMKFFLQLHLLTADTRYVDAFETAYYNAYLGSVNTDGGLPKDHSELFTHYDAKPAVLPFDSYSPLTAGTRGYGIGGFQPLGDQKFYGCCVCIAAAGVGLVPKAACLAAEDGVVINMYLDGSIHTKTASGTPLELVTETEYPKKGEVKITLNPEKDEEFTLYLRNPVWSKETAAAINGESVSAEKGYIKITRRWKKGDTVTLVLDMTPELIKPYVYEPMVLMNKVIWGANSIVVPTYDEQDPKAVEHFALRRGPIMLARDQRLGDEVEDPVSPLLPIVLTEAKTDFDTLYAAKLTLKDGETVTLCDYGSAGKQYDKKIAVWMRTK